MYQRKVLDFMQLAFLRKKESKKIAIIVFTIVLFLVVSFLTIYQTQIYQGKIWSYLGTSDDRFHMMRIEGLYHSLQRHQFFPILNMSFMNGFGYIVNIFYSDFMLYPAAFLRLMGLTSAQTLIGYYLFMNFLTLGVSFLCFYKVSHKYLNSLVFSFVYTLSTYRLYDLVFRHDIGEVAAFVFLPVVLLGIYEIFYGNRKQWLYLAFGMTGIVYSHAITPMLVAILIIIVAGCQYQELKINPKRLLSLLWATIVSALLTAAYFLPALEQVWHTKFILTQTKGTLPNGASNFADVTNWSLNNMIGQPNVGLIVILAAIVILVSATKIKNSAVKHFSIIGIILLLCSTKLFPWEFFDQTPLKMMQYPWRLDMIVTILLAVFIASDPLNIFSSKLAKAGLIFFVLLFALSSEYQLVNNSPLQLITHEEYNQLYPYSIGKGQEYLPQGTSLSALERASHKPKVISGKAKLSGFKQYGTRLSFDFKNAHKTKIDVPIIGYYGFQSTQSSGEVSELKMDKKHNNLAQVTVSGKGKVVVDYFETPTQKITRRISFLTFLIIVATLFINKLNLVDFDKIEGLRANKQSKKLNS